MKTRIVLMTAFVCCLGLLGCENGGSHQFTAYTTQMTGFVGDVARVDSTSLHRSVAAGKPIETSRLVKLEVKGPEPAPGPYSYDYDIILAPESTPGSVSQGTFLIIGDAPKFELESGWLFLWGVKPIALTEWVEAAADGTTMAIQIDSPNTHRVFLVRKVEISRKVYLTCRTGTGNAIMSTEGKYVDVTCDGAGNCTFSEEQDIVGDLRIKLNFFEALAKAAEWDE